MSPKKSKPARKPKSKTKMVIIEIETTATNEELEDHLTWTSMVHLLDPKGVVRQVTVQVADKTK
jgi:hypothetical protein